MEGCTYGRRTRIGGGRGPENFIKLRFSLRIGVSLVNVSLQGLQRMQKHLRGRAGSGCRESRQVDQFVLLQHGRSGRRGRDLLRGGVWLHNTSVAVTNQNDVSTPILVYWALFWEWDRNCPPTLLSLHVDCPGQSIIMPMLINAVVSLCQKSIPGNGMGMSEIGRVPGNRRACRGRVRSALV